MSKRSRHTKDPLPQLEATKRQADKHELPDELKPCVALMLEQGVPKGSEPDPDKACHIIGCEFRRLGVGHDAAAKICHDWQANTGEVLGYGEVERAVRSAYGGKHEYGCGVDGPLYNSDYCMGHETCPYYKKLGGKQEPRDLDFFESGWPQILSSAAFRTYIAVMVLEHKRQAPGGKTFASYRQLEKYGGEDKARIKKALDELKRHGLITYKPGKVGSRHAKATEIQRVIPIPEPPRRLTE